MLLHIPVFIKKKIQLKLQRNKVTEHFDDNSDREISKLIIGDFLDLKYNKLNVNYL